VFITVVLRVVERCIVVVVNLVDGLLFCGEFFLGEFFLGEFFLLDRDLLDRDPDLGIFLNKLFFETYLIL